MMKKCYFVLAIAGFFCFATTSFAASSAVNTATKEAATAVSSDESAPALEMDAAKAAKSDWKNLSAKEKREKRKAVKQAVKSAKKNGADTNTLLLVILAILLAPLAMAIYDGISNRFWISLLLWILGILPGIIYTLYVILSES